MGRRGQRGASGSESRAGKLGRSGKSSGPVDGVTKGEGGAGVEVGPGFCAENVQGLQ